MIERWPSNNGLEVIVGAKNDIESFVTPGRLERNM